jgi:hypothetical protein
MRSLPVHETLVVDASHTRSPPELWDWFAQVAHGTAFEPVERSVQGIHRALLTGEPATIEIHGVEGLVAAGHRALVTELEREAELVARQVTESRLFVARRTSSPRGRLFQHVAFRSRALVGQRLERVVSDPSAGIVCLKPVGREWQRFFLDLGAAFWEEWDEESTLDGFEPTPDPLPDLIGAELGEVEAAPFGRQGSLLRIGLAGGAIWLIPVDPNDLESRSAVQIVPPRA